MIINRIKENMVFNDITELMDKYLYEPIEGFFTYIYPINDTTWFIRYPGQTVGAVNIIGKNIIRIRINMTGETDTINRLYKPELIEEIKRFEKEEYEWDKESIKILNRKASRQNGK